MADFRALFGVLAEAGIEYVLVGGVAATVHGSARLTQDVDIVYSRSKRNLSRLENALAPHHPYLRGAPPGLPFEWSAATLERGLNFTLVTDLGAIDLLGEIVGGGGYEALVAHSEPVELFGYAVRCLDLETLIAVKRAAGRPKDIEALAELEVIREERGDSP
jgi:predicted nucleotidyltransferase